MSRGTGSSVWLSDHELAVIAVFGNSDLILKVVAKLREDAPCGTCRFAKTTGLTARFWVS